MNTTPQLSVRQRTPILLCCLASVAASLIAASPIATAVPPALNIAQKPLFLGGTDPNVLFVLDDSGSMNFAFMPEIIGKYALTDPNNSGSACLGENAMPRRLTSAQYNTLYYDPSVTYLPPMNADGSTKANATFAAAWTNGFNTSEGTTNLNSYKALFSPGTYTTAGTKCNYLDSTAKAAYYHLFNASNAGCTINNAVSPPLPNDSCYTRVTVGASEQQNFANWFSYYRMRLLTAKTGVSRAFAQATSALYLGYGSINTSGMVARGVLPFKDGIPAATNTSRTQFFNWLFAKTTSGSTPLRPALEDAGKYYETQTAPWSSKPWDTANGNAVSCRQSYTILMTDGYWNGGSAVGNAKNDNDGTAGSTINPATGSSLSPYTYTPSAPFKDATTGTRSDTLADVAMYYWKRDIRTDLANNVPVGLTSIDNAFWQHMTTFTIGLGFSSTVNKVRAFNSITAKTGDADFGYPASWPAPAADSENNIDDLLHAGVNGHGGFFSAKNPTEFANALGDTLASIAARQVSAAAAVVNSGTLSADSVLYQATFNSSKWSGDVVGYKIDPSTQALTELAKASDGVPSPASRKIYTWRPSYTSGSTTIPAAAVTFIEPNLSPNQTAAITTGISGASLGSTTVGDIVNYVRGDRSKELSNSGTLRNRDGVIGDIINSDPAYARKMNLGYKYALGLSAAARSTYDTFVASQVPTLYVGANDGMLHAFNGSKAAGDALDELFAYIPNSVIGNLPYLAKSTDFAHKYFVDGPTTVSHAYLNGSWKTILVGATGAGGKAYFAIDVTVPSSPVVMWEFSDTNDSALGNTMGKTAVVHLANGKWAAVFGNGYNSTAQTASLFVVDLETGTLIKKLDVTSRDLLLPNGLSAPAVSDLDGDGNGDLVYAGDLQGNLWKFNLSDINPANWAISFGGKPLFQTPITTDVLGTHRQSITIKPELARHPQGGSLVMFGTGKFFETGDQSNVDMQTFYGIRDECGFSTGAGCTTGVSTTKVALNDLLQQTFTGSTVRILSKNTDNTKKGYYINLRLGTTNTGERVISNMLLLDDRIIFTSVIPNEDVCGFGGDSWLWELNLLTGGETPYSVFDLNNDGKFDDTDRGNAVKRNGLARTPALVVTPGSAVGHLKINDNGDTPTNVYGEFGRQTWRKVR